MVFCFQDIPRILRLLKMVQILTITVTITHVETGCILNNQFLPGLVLEKTYQEAVATPHHTL